MKNGNPQGKALGILMRCLPVVPAGLEKAESVGLLVSPTDVWSGDAKMTIMYYGYYTIGELRHGIEGAVIADRAVFQDRIKKRWSSEVFSFGREEYLFLPAYKSRFDCFVWVPSDQWDIGWNFHLFHSSLLSWPLCLPRQTSYVLQLLNHFYK